MKALTVKILTRHFGAERAVFLDLIFADGFSWYRKGLFMWLRVSDRLASRYH